LPPPDEPQPLPSAASSTTAIDAAAALREYRLCRLIICASNASNVFAFLCFIDLADERTMSDGLHSRADRQPAGRRCDNSAGRLIPRDPKTAARGLSFPLLTGAHRTCERRGEIDDRSEWSDQGRPAYAAAPR